MTIELKLGPENLSCDFKFSIFDYKCYLINNIAAKHHVKPCIPENIGLYLSGGIDSTALLCLILTDLKNQNLLDKIPVYCFSVAKANANDSYAIDIIEKVEKHFNCKINFVPNIENDQYEHGNIGNNALNKVKNYLPKMLVFMGNNRPANFKQFKNTLKVEYGYQIETPRYVSPFLFLHKPQTIDILYKLGCEWLIPYTHSCGNLKEGKCGDCFGCEERSWGFEMLGLDPTM